MRNGIRKVGLKFDLRSTKTYCKNEIRLITCSI